VKLLVLYLGSLMNSSQRKNNPRQFLPGVVLDNFLEQVWDLLLGCQVGLSEHQGDRC
jgi:hypothetical protein